MTNQQPDRERARSRPVAVSVEVLTSPGRCAAPYSVLSVVDNRFRTDPSPSWAGDQRASSGRPVARSASATACIDSGEFSSAG
jgi:hypothetical protein